MATVQFCQKLELQAMRGCNPPVNRVEELEVANQKQNKQSWPSNPCTRERDLQDFVSDGQVSIVLSCQLVLAMFQAVPETKTNLYKVRENGDSRNS